MRERAKFFAEVGRILKSGGRFLLTDAGVLSSAISGEEVRRRSTQGDAHFVPVGVNEKLLVAAGLKIIETEDRTEATVKNASGRLAALRANRTELEHVIGAESLDRQLPYLETVADLARRRALSRIMYLSEKPR